MLATATCNIHDLQGWQIANGAASTAVLISYAEGERPSRGILPHVAAADVPKYAGPPPYDDNLKHSNWVPTRPTERRERRCEACSGCTRTNIPLLCANATTPHKVQGWTAGPDQAFETMLWGLCCEANAP